MVWLMSDYDTYDAIVVGGGISGLLSALTLGKKGNSVLLLEKADVLGGNCRTYEPPDYPGWRVDTGVHAITGLIYGPLKQLNHYFDPGNSPHSDSILITIFAKKVDWKNFHQLSLVS